MTTIRLETECGATIYRGFFGKDADGNHDECSNVIVVETEDERSEWEPEHEGDPAPESWRGPIVVYCDACGSLLEWPQLWTLAADDEPLRGVGNGPHEADDDEDENPAEDPISER